MTRYLACSVALGGVLRSSDAIIRKARYLLAQGSVFRLVEIGWLNNSPQHQGTVMTCCSACSDALAGCPNAITQKARHLFESWVGVEPPEISLFYTRPRHRGTTATRHDASFGIFRRTGRSSDRNNTESAIPAWSGVDVERAHGDRP